MLERLKTFAKRVPKAAKEAEKADNPRRNPAREFDARREIAQVLYDLAAPRSLAPGARVVGLSDDRYRKNVFWLLNQPWLDTRLRPVFSAVKRLDG